MNWRRWPWLELGALPLAVVGIGIAWLWPWILVLSRWLLPPEQRPILPLWTMLLLVAGGAITARLLTVDPERPWRAQSVAIASGLLAILLTVWWRLSSGDYALWDYHWLVEHGYILTHWGGTIPATVLVSILVAYLWLRGMRDSDSPNHDDVLRAFGIGFGALVVLLLLSRIDPAVLTPGTIRWIVIFFAVAMAAMAMAGLRMARGTRNPNATLPINRYWTASIVALIVVLLSAGLLLSLLITPDAIARASSMLSFVADFVIQIGIWILYALVYVIFLFLTPLIHWLENNLGLQLSFDTSRIGDMRQNAMEQNDAIEPVTVPPAVEESMRWLLLLAAIIVIALAFAGALRLLRKRNEDDEDEIRETVLSQELLKDQAKSLWDRLRDRMRRDAETVYNPYFALDGVDAHRQRIRQTYQAFLAHASALGYPRRRRQTPGSYAGYLEENDVADHVDLQALTGAYVTARYSITEPSSADVDAAENAWSSIQRSSPDANTPQP